jgi:hypothetical protein
MRAAALVFLCSICLSLFSLSALGQVPGKDFGDWSRLPGGTQSIGVSTSYSPDSSHIFIGLAEQRRTWTAGIEYTHLLSYGNKLRWDYEGSVTPLYAESDPVSIGMTATVAGTTYMTPEAPQRVTFVNHAPVGIAHALDGAVSPIYPVYSRQTTYAAGVAPLGARVTAFPRRALRLSFAVDLGFVVSPRDMPVDLSDQFNYMFAFGPGVELYTSQSSSVRLEYIYRHISNADEGFVNPGVDQGVVRLTVSQHR